MTWRELFDYITGKLDAARQAIDVEPEHRAEVVAYQTKQAIEQSRAERFLQQMAQAVDAVLREEIIRTPSGKAYIPERFVIFLNPEDDRALQGKKRDFVKTELAQIIFEEARHRAGDSELTTDKIEIDMRIDATLEEDELRVSAVFDDKRELTVVADKERTVVLGEKQFTLSEIKEDKQTVFIEPLYNVEIWEGEKRVAEIPVYKRQAVIGRGTNNMPVEIPLNRAAVSRRHALLEIDDNDEFWLTHIGSNPTVVNNEELPPDSKTPLDAEKNLEISGYNLKLVIPNGQKDLSTNKLG
jgi:hypothetical protein